MKGTSIDIDQYVKDTKYVFTKNLLNIGAIKINLDEPYTWASGWNSPIYCDNRKILAYPAVRQIVIIELCKIITDNFPDVQCISGVATAGISHGVLVANEMGLPFNYVRPKPKEHGMRNQIEGVVKPGQKTIVIEDLVSTGMSSLNAVDALRKEGADVIGMCALFTYGFPEAIKAFSDHDVPLCVISNYGILMEVCEKEGLINTEEKTILENWRLNPSTWVKEN